MVQAEAVGKYVNRLNPRVGMRLVPIESEADRTEGPLAPHGGKGLFTRAIERALLSKQADIAVHSLKDLPTEGTPGLILAATPKRAAVEDVLIARDADRIADLPRGGTVGTSSPRRAAQVLRLRSDLKIVHLRGNVETRIAKVMENGEIDATILAAAGLNRLGLSEHLKKIIPVEDMLPAAAQGALGIQCRVDDHVTLRRCMPLNDAITSIRVNAERQVVAKLKADCFSPLAVLAEPIGLDELRLRARVLSLDGSEMAEADVTAAVDRIAALSSEVTQILLDQGARKLLDDAGKAMMAAKA